MRELRIMPLEALKLDEELNSRKDLGDLTDLIASIKEEGVLEPPLADKNGTVYVGYRRVNAAIEAGLQEIPVLVDTKKISAKQMTLCNITENVQRVNLNPIEEANAIRKLHEEFSMSLDEVATALGLSKNVVRQRVGLLKLSSFIQEAISEGRLTVSSALEISRLPLEKQGPFIKKAQELAGVKLVKMIDKELEKIEKASQETIPETQEEEISVEDSIFESTIAEIQSILLQEGLSKKSVKKVTFKDAIEEERNALVTIVNFIDRSEDSEVLMNPNVEQEVYDVVSQNTEALDLSSDYVKEAIKEGIVKLAKSKVTKDNKKVTLLMAQEALEKFFIV